MKKLIFIVISVIINVLIKTVCKYINSISLHIIVISVKAKVQVILVSNVEIVSQNMTHMIRHTQGHTVGRSLMIDSNVRNVSLNLTA